LIYKVKACIVQRIESDSVGIAYIVYQLQLMKILRLHPIEQYAVDMVSKMRREHKLTQRDIATILHTQASFVGNVENVSCNAKYNLKHLQLLAIYFQVSPKIFLPEKATSTDEEN